MSLNRFSWSSADEVSVFYIDDPSISRGLFEDMLRGGEGSGNFGHAGREGEVGGSSNEGGTSIPADKDASEIHASFIKEVKYKLSRSSPQDKQAVKKMEFDETCRTANAKLRDEVIPESWGIVGTGDEQLDTYEQGFNGIASQTPHSFDSFRGVSLSDTELEALSPGTSFLDKGYSSTTSSDTVAGLFANMRASDENKNLAILKIRVPKGSKVAPLPNSVKEIVLDKGTTFTVTSVTKNYKPTSKTKLPKGYMPPENMQIGDLSFTVIEVTASNPTTNRYPDDPSHAYLWFPPQ